MDRPKKPPASIDAYIAASPEKIRGRLEAIREIVHRVAPDAREKISYGMPAFEMGRILVYFAAHANHIGLYPGASTIEAFAQELEGFRTAKGTVQLPHGAPLPRELIARMVEFRAGECRSAAGRKRGSK